MELQMCLWCATVTYVLRRNCGCVGHLLINLFFSVKFSSARLEASLVYYDESDGGLKVEAQQMFALTTSCA